MYDGRKDFGIKTYGFVMKKTLWWLGIAFVALVAAPLLVLIAINLPDEDLTPEAAAYAAPRAPSVPEAENGHYALLALNASDGADAMAYARAWVAEARSAARERRNRSPSAS